ncbi:MAG: ABC transporter substrate-binding protein [Syntrophaceae bacterium]
MRKANRIVASCFFLCLCLLASGTAWAAEETPMARVKAILDEVMAVQNDQQLQGQENRGRRRALIKKTIGQNFYFEDMARESLGPHWEKLNAAQRKEFIGVFQDLFQDSYTKLVLDFLKKEKILYQKEEVKDGQATVNTTIARMNENIPVDYSLVLAQGKWLVRDVAIDKVSIVRNYQKSFSRTIQRESYKSLLQKMRRQQKAIEKPSAGTGPAGRKQQ